MHDVSPWAETLWQSWVCEARNPPTCFGIMAAGGAEMLSGLTGMMALAWMGWQLECFLHAGFWDVILNSGLVEPHPLFPSPH